MDRRNFLKTTGSMAAAATAVAPAAVLASGHGAVAAPAILAGSRELGLAFDWPDNDQGLGDSARRLVQRVSDATAGRVRFVVRTGADTASAEVRHGTAHDHLVHDKAFAYFAGLPGQAGLPAAELETWLAMSEGQELWDHLASGRGLKSLLAGHSGSAPMLWSKTPVSSVSNLSGKRIASGGLADDVIRGLGGEPVSVMPKDASAALASGRIDAIEWGGAMHAHVLGLPAVAGHATGPFVSRQGTAQSLDINLSTWQSLTAADQAAIAAAASDEFRMTASEARFNEAVARRVASQRHATEFRDVTADLSGAIDRVSDAVVAHVAGSSRVASRINASYMAFRALVLQQQSPPVA